MDRLNAGEVIIGDGSYTITLEKRGYTLANAWTPEASVEHPEAVRNLALEFARAGADITQTYTFFSDEKRLKDWHGPDIPSVRTYIFCNILIFYLPKIIISFSVTKSITLHAQ